MSNSEIAGVFNFIAGVLSLHDSTPWRARAYQNAAAVMEQADKPLHEMFLNDPKFADLPGIGEAIQKKLAELFTTGDIKAFQEYVEKVPGGTYSLDKVHGIGVKKAYKLSVLFGLDNPDTAISELLAVAQAGKVRDIEGFGEKSENDLIIALQAHVPKQRMSYNDAKAIADQVVAELTECPDIVTVEVLGSLRRRLESVGDVDIGIAVKDIGSVKTCVKKMKSVKRVIVAGDQLIRIHLHNDQQVDIKVAQPAEWGSFLQHFTGSKEHNIRLREFALKQGKSLSEHGIKIKDQLKPYATEEEFYAALGLRWIPPEQRVGGEEINQAKM